MNPENNESIENHDVFLDSTDRKSVFQASLV